jgi:uncharacterized protein (DUF849 family)
VRLVSLSCLLALALVGCTAERPEQQLAREAVEAHLAGVAGYDDHVRCTRNPRPWFIEEPADEIICAARRDDGDCDWFRVTAEGGVVTVALDRERGGCILPV